MIKLAKGTRDYDGLDYHKLEYLKNLIQDIFVKYDGNPVETPVFELTDVLTGKYGEEEKLIYNLEKSDELNLIQFRESLSLRYDHTIPFVRYCVTNKIEKMKRYCIGKVYRRETTALAQIRQREFYQADFDFVGQYDEFLPELQIFCMIQELFDTLNISNYQIMYNYRQNLDYYVKESGISQDKFQTVCSSIDKLDKLEKETVRDELLSKGIEEEQINKLYDFLFSDNIIMEPNILQMDQTFTKYMQYINILDLTKIKFTPALARGLDYYTGIIFEVKLLDDNKKTMTLCAGGRYDNLMNLYKKDNNIQPMIGFCFGIDRILPLVELQEQECPIKIWVSTIGKITDSTMIKLKIVGQLTNKGFSVMYNLSDRSFKKEIMDASDKKCDFMIMIGQRELDNKSFSIKDMNSHTQTLVPIDQLETYFDQFEWFLA